MQRIKSLDLARGFTVLMIAPIHTVLLYSSPGIQSTVLGSCLAFIAEGPGAQLFMLLMGVYFSFQQQHKLLAVAKKASLLLIGGYVLNTVKFVVPMSLGLLPAGLKAYLQLGENGHGYLQLFLLGDILQFASLALIVLFFIKRLYNYQYWALALAIIICFCAPLFWDMHCRYFFADYFLRLIGGQPPYVFFPLFPWLVYPLLGLTVGYFLQQNNSRLFFRLRDTGVLLIVSGFLMKIFLQSQTSESFYRTLPADTLQHAGIVFITLYVWEWLSRYVSQNYFFRLLKYMSCHITQVYLIQWTVIAWMLPLFGYQQLNYTNSLIAVLITSLLTFFISVAINLINGRKLKAR